MGLHLQLKLAMMPQVCLWGVLRCAFGPADPKCGGHSKC